MKAAIVLLLVLCLAALTLALTCPSEASFDRYITKRSTADDANILEKAGAAVTTAQARMTADYEDHRLWATVEVTRGVHRERYLGVAGTWLQLEDGRD